jgi:hypothetical protein
MGSITRRGKAAFVSARAPHVEWRVSRVPACAREDRLSTRITIDRRGSRTGPSTSETAPGTGHSCTSAPIAEANQSARLAPARKPYPGLSLSHPVLCLFMASLIASTSVSCSRKRNPPSAFPIQPGMCVGPVTFAMSKDTVEMALGPPSWEGAFVLNYNNYGLTITFRRSGKVGAVSCGSIDGDASLIAAFKGSLPSGITLGATGEQIIKHYGVPDETRENGTFLRYNRLHADFILRRGRLACIIVRSNTSG